VYLYVKMLLLGIITLVMTIPLASLYLSTILIHRIAGYILPERYSFILNSVIYSRLFQTSSQTIWDIIFKILFIFLLCGSGYEEEGGSLGESFILFSDIPSFQVSLLATAVIVYSNAETDRSQILSDNKGKAGVYQWKHNKSSKIYIGSAVDLSKRFRCYYSKTYLTRSSNSYINNALIKFGYDAFSLTIIEHINISDLSLEQTRLLILEREQYYIDSFKPEYNINPIAGSRLGSVHTEETKSLMSRPRSEKTKALISLAMSGQNHHQWGKTGENKILVKIILLRLVIK
jgi:group I intron endonuclease